MITPMSFSWLIDGEVAGSGGPRTVEDLSYLQEQGVEALVRMVDDAAARSLHQTVEETGLLDHYEPVPDFTAPSPQQLEGMVTFIRECVSKSIPVGVSCMAGLGRTGTVLACYLVEDKGCEAEEAVRRVRQARPGSLENEMQVGAVRAYAQRLHEGGG